MAIIYCQRFQINNILRVEKLKLNFEKIFEIRNWEIYMHKFKLDHYSDEIENSNFLLKMNPQFFDQIPFWDLNISKMSLHLNHILY